MGAMLLTRGRFQELPRRIDEKGVGGARVSGLSWKQGGSFDRAGPISPLHSYAVVLVHARRQTQSALPSHLTPHPIPPPSLPTRNSWR